MDAVQDSRVHYTCMQIYCEFEEATKNHRQYSLSRSFTLTLRAVIQLCYLLLPLSHYQRLFE